MVLHDSAFYQAVFNRHSTRSIKSTVVVMSSLVLLYVACLPIFLLVWLNYLSSIPLIWCDVTAQHIILFGIVNYMQVLCLFEEHPDIVTISTHWKKNQLGSLWHILVLKCPLGVDYKRMFVFCSLPRILQLFTTESIFWKFYAERKSTISIFAYVWVIDMYYLIPYRCQILLHIILGIK